MRIDEFIDAFPHARMYRNEPLKYYAYTKVGGPADLLVFPATIEELQQMIQKATQLDVLFSILGNSSNVLISDAGMEGIVFMLTDLVQISVQDNQITAEAGAKIIDVSRTATEAAVTGLEFACGIPGSVGGAVYMNAGAYGGEIKDVVTSATVITPEGEIKELSHDTLDFGYRHSYIQQSGDTVVSVTFTLAPGNAEEIQETVADLTKRRETKQPLNLPSCGSVFKRPEGHYTGQLVQEADLQGYQVGGAQVSKKHAGFIVNIDHGTAQDYLDVIHHVQEIIWERNQVRLETEVRIIGKEMK